MDKNNKCLYKKPKLKIHGNLKSITKKHGPNRDSSNAFFAS